MQAFIQFYPGCKNVTLEIATGSSGCYTASEKKIKTTLDFQFLPRDAKHPRY